MPTVYGDSFSLVSKKKSGSYGGNKQVVLRSKEGKENVPLRFPHQRTRLLFLSFFLFFFSFLERILLWQSRQLFARSPHRNVPTLLFERKHGRWWGCVVPGRAERYCWWRRPVIMIFFVWLVNCPSKKKTKKKKRTARCIYSIDLEGVLCLCVPFFADVRGTQWWL